MEKGHTEMLLGDLEEESGKKCYMIVVDSTAGEKVMVEDIYRPSNK